MSIPLTWAVGDRCAVRRDGELHIGVVESLGEGCASVKISEWRRVFCGLDELELVPFATASTVPAPADQDVGSAPVGSPPPGGGAADYSDFVSRKLTRAPSTGLAVVPDLHPSLFAFQKDLVAWALRRGRAALFADTGLGKTRMQLEWARHVAAATGGDVLILAPLAVAAQTAREGEHLGVSVTICRQGSDVRPGVNITNYDRLHRFDPSIFRGVVLDESSIIKHHDAKTLTTLLAAFRETPFKLAATATPSPNDYTELGTHAEFLGVCTRAEMLAEYFVHDGGSTQDWRLKGHARGAFWRWVATWGALLRKPSDLGYSDEGYDLPPLNVEQHTIAVDVAELNAKTEGQTSLFAEPAKTLAERRVARASTVDDRVRRVFELVTMGCERCQNTKKLNANTCGSTTGEIATNGDGHRNSESGITQSDANSTPPTPPSEKRRVRKHENGPTAIRTSDTPRSYASSASSHGNTELCLSDNTGAALSADEKRTSTRTDDSTSTTIIAPDEFEGFFAPRVTSGSGSSVTTPIDSRWPRDTCGCHASERWVIWCELNKEQEQLARLLGDDCVSITGSDEPLMKEARLLEFLRGRGRILLSKPSIAGWGINLQSVARMAFVGVKDSWESYYQSVRRCWRFGQRRPVDVHIYASELEGNVTENLRRKERDAIAMAEQLGAETRDAVRAEVCGSKRDTNECAPGVAMTLPAWLREESAA